MDARMRASDGDRERVVQALHRHTADGRLNLDEFTGRVDAANHAATHGELATLTADLPDLPDLPARRRVPCGPLAAVLVVAAVLAVLLGAGAAAQAADVLHMNGMMAAMSTGTSGCR